MDNCLPDRLNFLSDLTGSFSTPSAQNPTVRMIEAAYRHHRLDARYLNCEVGPAALGDAIRGARAMGWRGFNCSLPHKLAVIEHVDELDASARLIGAVNCVSIRDGRLVGHNTDGQGFLRSLRSCVEPRGKSLLIFGAGGAARAIAVEAALAGVASLLVVNRQRQRGESLAAHLAQATGTRAGFAVWTPQFRIPELTDIVVNATSVGLYPDGDALPDIDLASLRPGMVLADVIPNPPRTALIRQGEQRGCTVLDGLGMLVNQGVASIRHWFDIDVDAAVMRAALQDVFA